MGHKKPPGKKKYGRWRARKRLELYYEREAEVNQRWKRQWQSRFKHWLIMRSFARNLIKCGRII